MSAYIFPGFDVLSYTPIPDSFIDELMCHLTEAELRVALYIMRRTFGFKKRADDISINQMVNGITTRDGRVLDQGCGVQRAAIIRAVRGLESKGVVIAHRNQSPERGNEATTYALRFKGEDLKDPRGRILSEPPPRSIGIPAPGSQGSPQETGLQETDHKKTGTSTAPSALDITIDQVSVALGEPRKKKANRTRASAATEGLSPDFAAQLAERALIRVKVQMEQGAIDNPMAYYFGVLTDLVKQAQNGGTKPKGRRGGLAGPYSHIVRS